MNTKRSTFITPTIGLAVVLLACCPVLKVSFSPPISAAERQPYEPVAEVVLPPDDANVPRSVEEKDGYLYLLAREGVLYTYDISDLLLQGSFVTYDTPVFQQSAYNGNGLVRYGDYLYVFGSNGLQTMDVRDAGMPSRLGLTNDLNIYNMVRHENYLIAAGAERIVVYSIDEPSNPTFLSDLNMGGEQLVWSAAVYGRTLYACHWTSDWQGSYTNSLSMIDFSNPASLLVLNAVSRDDQAYHLRVMGGRLIECTSNQVGLWDLTTPADPVLLTAQPAGGRVCALDGGNIVTNGAVFRPDGNDLQIVATFAAGDSQRDGFPYGSTVSERFIFLAQSRRILVLNAAMPQGKYGGGSGTPDDPYQIATAADLIALGETPEDYDKHFILTADIDMDPNLPGGKIFDKAVIAPDIDPNDEGGNFQGTLFAGTFDGNGYTISHLMIEGVGYLGLFGGLVFGAEVRDLGVVGARIAGSADCVGVLAGCNDNGSIVSSYSSGSVSAVGCVGGLVGFKCYGSITTSNSSALVNGRIDVGGLVGRHLKDRIDASYSTGAVSGQIHVGGLVGFNIYGNFTQCYSTGSVSGKEYVGGLIGQCSREFGTSAITQCFWDSQTSGQATSAGGTGKITVELQTAKTFLDAGWDFVGETANGTEDVWWIDEGKDYPRLWWEARD